LDIQLSANRLGVFCLEQALKPSHVLMDLEPSLYPNDLALERYAALVSTESYFPLRDTPGQTDKHYGMWMHFTPSLN
jgi:hypothetical protein